MLLDRSILGKGAAGGFKNFQMLLQILRNVNRNAALQRKGMELGNAFEDC
jgi:hypothetical protein